MIQANAYSMQSKSIKRLIPKSGRAIKIDLTAHRKATPRSSDVGKACAQTVATLEVIIKNTHFALWPQAFLGFFTEGMR